MHNDIVRSIDVGEVSLLVLLDLSAAFDTVDHEYYLKYFRIDLVFKIVHSTGSSRTYPTAPNRFV